MENFEIQSAKYYYAGFEKSHISIFPVVVTKSFCNGKQIVAPYNINLKSAFFNGQSWRWQQIFTGEDENMPLKTWQDVRLFAELELKRLASILEPLFEDDKLNAWNRIQEINNRSGVIIKGIEIEENEDDLIEQLIHGNKPNVSKFVFMELDDWQDSPRTKIEHWMPIWIAWKTFYDRFIIDLKENKLMVIE